MPQNLVFLVRYDPGPIFFSENLGIGVGIRLNSGANHDHPFPHPLLARLLSYCSVSLSGDCGRLFPPPVGGSGGRSLFPPPAGGGGARDGGGGGPVELI